jgi:oxygen-independent coproporphyrinogen-3 oxidase
MPREEIGSLARAQELLLMGLRLREGLDLDRYEALLGRPMDSEALEDLAGLGLLRQEGRCVFATAAGRLLLNEVIRRLDVATES